MSDIRERLVRFAGKVCISTDTEIEAAATIDKLRDGMRDIIQERDVLSGENWELRAENAKLQAALKDCASDLEAEIRGRYTGGGSCDVHPSLVKDFEKDMATVRAAAAAIREGENRDD